jgi:asparagine synthetase B (glutamine-hydrolysing)
MEPWDGPAAIAATDNEWVIAANDRNGLRPLRYTITKDKLLFAGSETGMINLNEKRSLSFVIVYLRGLKPLRSLAAITHSLSVAAIAAGPSQGSIVLFKKLNNC